MRVAPKVLFSFIMTWFVLFFSSGQDIQLSSFYNLPMYMNPAMTGSAHNYRGILHSRLQWPGLNAKYFTNVFSFDKYFNHYKSGAGLMVINDRQGEGGSINTTNVSMHYAYEMHINHIYTLRFGLSPAIVNRRLLPKYIFPDELSNDGNNGLSSEDRNSIKNSGWNVDFSAGGVFYSEKYWVGAAFSHLNRPDIGYWLDGVARQPIKGSMHFGYRIPLTHKKYMAYLDSEKDISITPTAQYRFQGKSDQVDIGVYGAYDQVLVGFWYRGIPVKKYEKGLQNNESLVFSLGWRYDSYHIGYSYDALVSGLAGYGRGAHEINLTYIHQKHHKARKPMKRIPCPTFYK